MPPGREVTNPMILHRTPIIKVQNTMKNEDSFMMLLDSLVSGRRSWQGPNSQGISLFARFVSLAVSYFQEIPAPALTGGSGCSKHELFRYQRVNAGKICCRFSPQRGQFRIKLTSAIEQTTSKPGCTSSRSHGITAL